MMKKIICDSLYWGSSWSVHASTTLSIAVNGATAETIIDGVISITRDCGSVQGTCKDEASIMYAWARNAPATELPRGMF